MYISMSTESIIIVSPNIICLLIHLYYCLLYRGSITYFINIFYYIIFSCVSCVSCVSSFVYFLAKKFFSKDIKKYKETQIFFIILFSLVSLKYKNFSPHKGFSLCSLRNKYILFYFFCLHRDILVL